MAGVELLDAVRSGNMSQFTKLYINKKCTPNTVFTPGNRSLLSQASKHNSSKIVEFLIQKKADLNTTNHKGRTAFILAVKNNAYESASMLMVAGCDVNHVDNFGLQAREYVNTKRMKYLLEDNCAKHQTGFSLFCESDFPSLA